MLKNFEIDPQYLTDLQEVFTIDLVKDRNNPTPDEIILILRGSDTIRNIHTIDHPEFTKLRNKLEELRYIKIERSWWNGDTVLKSFKLNGWILRKDFSFPCAAALGITIKFAGNRKRSNACINV